jgi:hypothetical protein
MDAKLKRYLKGQFYLCEKQDFGIVYETEESFTIRCYIPHSGSKYHVICKEGDSDVLYCKPRSGCKYNSVVLEIRNIWETDIKRGYNIELKETKN